MVNALLSGSERFSYCHESQDKQQLNGARNFGLSFNCQELWCLHTGRGCMVGWVGRRGRYNAWLKPCAVPVLYWSRCGPGLDHLHCNADMLFMRLFAVCVQATTCFQDSIRDVICYLESKDLILL